MIRAAAGLGALAIAAHLSAACIGARTPPSPPSSRNDIHVTVLSSAGCGSTDSVVQRVSEVATRLGFALQIERILVETPEAASRLRLLGSPTIQVNGKDLEPSARGRTDFGFS